MWQRPAAKFGGNSLAMAAVIVAMVGLGLSRSAAAENILVPRRASISGDRIAAVFSDGKVIDFDREASGLLDQRMVSNGFQMGLPMEPQPQSSPSSRRIIGSDDRVRIQDTTIFPFSAVVKIEGQFTPKDVFVCSGWMLGQSTVVTAGHCIYDFHTTRQFAYNITVTPAYNAAASNPAPFGRCKAVRGIVLSPWLNAGAMGYDYGVYQLDCRIGARTGNLGFRVIRGCGVGTLVAVTGYPVDKGGTTMWTGPGAITSCDTSSSYYNADTAGWQSGGPVWDVLDPLCQACVVAIHANEFASPAMNQGPRIDDAAFSFFSYAQSFVAPLPINPPALMR